MLLGGQQCEIIVGLGGRGERLIRRRQELLQNLRRYRIDAVCRNDVSGERRPVLSRPVLRAGQRIVNLMPDVSAQVAGAERAVGNAFLVGVGLMIQRPHVVGEEEELIVLDRPADIAAEIVVCDVSHRGIEKRSRIQVAILQILVAGAVKLIGSRLDHHIHDRAGGAAQFRIVVGGGNVDRLNRLRRRNQNLQQPRFFVIVDALDLIVIAHARLSVHVRLHGAGRVKKLRMLEGLLHRAGHQVQKILEIPVDAEGQFLHQLRIHGAPGIGAIGLQNSGHRRHFHRLRHVARHHLQIHAWAGVGFQNYAAVHFALESRHLHRYFVQPGRHLGKTIKTGFVGQPGVNDLGVGLRERHFGVDNRPTRRIGDGSDDRPIHCLSESQARTQHTQQTQATDRT